MGEYELEEERVNEFPLYKKADESHCIYRNTSGNKGLLLYMQGGTGQIYNIILHIMYIIIDI